MSKHGKILVAMSGGIDSTVAAMMLHDEGYEVVGITMKTWDYESSGVVNGKETGCCSLDSLNDARMMAVERGFPHLILDIRDEFNSFIVSNFVDEYMAGRTPNPCVLCNTHIKWDALLKRADMLDCEYIATGHYAQLRNENNRWIISKGKDEHKDQSYVLWGLSQKSLQRTKFPLGQYTKQEIRKIALENGLTELVQKSESYEICFVPDNDYRAFLKRKVKNLRELEGGNFIDKNGKILGKHKGYPFYTIGQRKGLGIALGEPAYVIAINPKENTVTLGKKEDLARQKMYVKNPNIIKYETLPENIEALTKIRYKDKGTMAELKMIDENFLEVNFMSNVYGVAPGQSAVFYEDSDLIGGGFICREDEVTSHNTTPQNSEYINS